jgi:hypothetical protein
MTSKPEGGTVALYVSQEDFPWKNAFKGLAPGSNDFTKTWQEIAETHVEEFECSQHEFIKRNYFDIIAAKVKKNEGLDVTTRSRVLQDVFWSTAVQHGPNTPLISQALKMLKTQDALNLSDPDFEKKLIKAIYAQRGRRNADGCLVYFSKCSQSVQKGVAERFENEEKDALKMLEEET